ncbi:MAG: hypothetical protein Q8R13_00800, partial [bacterium]|nr:hypothetical protein [bacterium]
LPLHPSALYYNHAWGAVMMLGLAWPEKVFAGLLFHELGHRLRHLTEKAPSALAPPGSSLHTQEELDMHALEDAVFDAATEGKYGKYIEAFIAKNRRVRNVYQLISRLTLDDLHALDALLGCERCGPSIARLLAAQYLVSVGTRYLAATVEPARQSEKSIKLYQWYIGQFTAQGYGK